MGQYCSEREERVPLSPYERTFVAVLHFHFMTAFQRRSKRRRVFPFPYKHRRPSKVFLFFYSYNAFPHFFSTFSIRLSIPSLFHCLTGHESHRFQCQSRINNHTLTFFSLQMNSLVFGIHMKFFNFFLRS